MRCVAVKIVTERLVVNSLGGTQTHTHTHTRIHVHTKSILRKQAYAYIGWIPAHAWFHKNYEMDKRDNVCFIFNPWCMRQGYGNCSVCETITQMTARKTAVSSKTTQRQLITWFAGKACSMSLALFVRKVRRIDGTN